MKGFFDVQCPQCRRKLGWDGEYRDRPACACGHRPSQADVDAAGAKLDQILSLVANPAADGVQLSEQRRLAGLTVGQAARLSGIGASVIRGYETGVLKPKPEDLAKLSEVYGCGGGE